MVDEISKFLTHISFYRLLQKATTLGVPPQVGEGGTRRVTGEAACVAQWSSRKQCGYIGLPQGGGGGPSKTVDEDVGSLFVGKHFGIRLFKGVSHSFVDRGSRTIDDRSYGFAQTTRRRSHVIVGDDALGVPCGTMEFARTTRRLASPLPLRVIPSEATKPSRGISTAQTERGRGMNTPNFFLQKSYFAPLKCNAFT